jgi:NAD(P)-dependent dehydrogenase (short-subunit alcohol dehydrogenase family)
MAQLSGVHALVTGATNGLGRAMAQALSDAGARVIVTGRDERRAAAAADAIGGETTGLAFDVRDPDAVARGVAHALDRLDQIDLLVNNAGIGMRTVNPRFMTDPQPFWEVSPTGFDDVLATKVTGAFLVARAVVPLMLAAGSGRVVTISMNTATMVRRGFVPYGPSGAAVEALGRVIAADLADTPVRANLLLPGGATATGMIPDDASDEVRSHLLPAAVMGPPIVWLASDAAADVHDERIVAAEFDEWLRARETVG